MPATFDLQAIMQAVPSASSKTPADMDPPSFIRMLPSEVLSEIFDIFSSDLAVLEDPLAAPMMLSHVSHFWREVVIDSLPTHWCTLNIRHVRHPEVLLDILGRSKNRTPDVNVYMPQTDPEPYPEDPNFIAVFSGIAAHASRVRRLSIVARNPTIHRIMRYIDRAPFSALENLELVQDGPDPTRFHFYGCFVVNPEVFSALRLVHTAAHFEDASNLGGVRTLDLDHSSGALLDQRAIRSIGYPNTPLTPCMTKLTQLTIIATRLLKLPTPFVPSFTSSDLRSLKLADVPATSTPDVRDEVIKLFSYTYTPDLQELSLERVHVSAFLLFMQMLDPKNPRFPAVTSLTLAEVHLDYINTMFMRAFPALKALSLIKIDPTPITRLLPDPLLWPVLSRITVDGCDVSRPSPILMITAP
ncbi:hypothetical protein BDQ12DRAFT_691561 [Crucibulum laeve]|uniref:F-box domain-containing protein n=1 Tax=Crucibulum laeve TaxID=68775 RepID=A0A5C3LK99_9AGAR|nr:hypothetical protein BDQ12DRAFT_691561 [Crucibulum laeve]